MPGLRSTGSKKSRDPALNSAGKIPQPFLLVIPGLLALGILLMFFIGKTGTHSKDLIYEDFESRIKRLEQRLARLEQGDYKSPQPKEKGKEINERLERLERAITRPDGIVAAAPTRRSQAENQSIPEPQAKPEPLEKEKGGGFHHVVEGDTLFKISRLYGVTLDDLRRWNNLPPGEGIRTGQKIRISDPNAGL